MPPTESWSIEVDKEYLKFSVAHFLIFPDGSAERLHGHNYRVFAEIEARLSPFGLVMDFQHIKPIIRDLCDELDEHWIVPGEHPHLSIERVEEGGLEIRYLERVYRAPVADVLVLPINNTSAENLSSYLGQELMTRLGQRFEDVFVRRLRMAVEETPGQRGVYTFAQEFPTSARG